MNPGAEPPAIEGLTNPRGITLARAPFRAREISVTLASWRLSLTADEGDASIMLVELPDGTSLFRGDGHCLGWSQERLAAAYAALQPTDGEPALDLPQLG